MKNYGFIPTLITQDTPKYQVKKTQPMPMKFSYRPFLSPVGNQGQDPYCVPFSLSVWLNWKKNSKLGFKLDNHVKYGDIYNSKKSKGEGMTFQEAFDYLKSHGVRTDKGIVKIAEAGYITSPLLLKAAILANGPCLGALPVYDSSQEMFWEKTQMKPEGYHAISIVGWTEKGYIIRNSWGTSFADGGYVVLPYEDANSFCELWTILG